MHRSSIFSWATSCCSTVLSWDWARWGEEDRWHDKQATLRHNDCRCGGRERERERERERGREEGGERHESRKKTFTAHPLLLDYSCDFYGDY